MASVYGQMRQTTVKQPRSVVSVNVMLEGKRSLEGGSVREKHPVVPTLVDTRWKALEVARQQNTCGRVCGAFRLVQENNWSIWT